MQFAVLFIVQLNIDNIMQKLYNILNSCINFPVWKIKPRFN